MRLPSQPVFRRQHPVGPYVLDFYCAKARLAVEVAGIAHDMGDRAQRELMANIDDIADAIFRMAAEKR
jgi:very-short-patch-repair endonuclease